MNLNLYRSIYYMLVFSRTSFLVFFQNFDDYKKMRLEEIDSLNLFFIEG